MLVKKVFLVERSGKNGHLLISVSALSQYTWHLLQCKHVGKNLNTSTANTAFTFHFTRLLKDSDVAETNLS